MKFSYIFTVIVLAICCVFNISAFPAIEDDIPMEDGKYSL